MRRSALLAAASIAALASGSGARAQAIVQDPLNLIQNTIAAIDGAVTKEKAIETVRQLVQTYQVTHSHYDAFMHQPDLIGMAQQLGGMSRTYLPEAGVMADMLGASRGGAQGIANQLLYGDAGRYITNNRLFRSEQDDEFQRNMDSREAVTGNAAALAMEGMRDAEDRIAKLEALRARLEASRGGTDVSAVNGLIEVERLNLQIHHGNVAKTQLMLAADDRAQMQRQDQRRRRDAEELFLNTADLAGSLR